MKDLLLGLIPRILTKKQVGARCIQCCISTGNKIPEVLRVVKRSGLPYKITPVETVVEGEWNDIMNLIKTCHATTMKYGEPLPRYPLMREPAE